jgi:hypothetical protein
LLLSGTQQIEDGLVNAAAVSLHGTCRTSPPLLIKHAMAWLQVAWHVSGVVSASESRFNLGLAQQALSFKSVSTPPLSSPSIEVQLNTLQKCS